MSITTPPDLETDEPSHEKLLKDNQELRGVCCYLDDTRQKSKRLAQEWQSFGKYTANVLRNEVLEFETKISILQEKLEKLSQENAELRDLCLFLNQMSNTGTTAGIKANSTTSDPKQSANQGGPYAMHAACVTDVNATLSDGPPQYSGFTGEAKLADNKQDVEPSNKEEEEKKSVPKGYVAQLEQRLERVEQEKLELIKSLSAAHILATSTEESEDIPETDDSEIEPPPNIKAFIEFISDDKDTDHSGNAQIAQQLSSDDVLKLSILVDISRRLDAYSNNMSLEPFEAAELIGLRALVNVSWEQLKNKHAKKKSSLTIKDSNKPMHLTQQAASIPTTTTTATTPPDVKNGGMVILRTEL